MATKRFTLVLLVLGGFILGVVVTIGVFFYFIRHYTKKTEEIAMKASGFPDQLDPRNRLGEAMAELNQAHNEYDRWVALTDVCLLEVDAGSRADARKHAEEVLSLAANYQSDWNYGNAIHKGNLTLGRLALRNGDVEKANQYLLEAGKTPGSPQLNSFGPNMVLAKELLERGEKKAVLQYFDLCNKFWEMHGDKLREWTALVKGGVIPDFGGNLLY